MKKEKQNKILSELAEKNSENYNLLKVAEECSELSKEIIDYINKPHKGNISKLADEYGDLVIRMNILIRKMGEGFKEYVESRIESKLKKYQKRLTDKSYDNI